MSGDKILVCTPMYGGMCHQAYFNSMVRLLDALRGRTLQIDILTGSKESLISRGRMEMTQTFLSSDATHQFWIDSDMDFTPDDAARVWNLLDGEADIAVGVYNMKSPDMPLSAWKDGKQIEWATSPDEPFEVDYAGTGFMMIPRHVTEKLAENVDHYENDRGDVAALYQTPIHDGIFESEDYFFCRQARHAGFKIMTDPQCRPGHWGQARFCQPVGQNGSA